MLPTNICVIDCVCGATDDDASDTSSSASGWLTLPCLDLAAESRRTPPTVPRSGRCPPALFISPRRLFWRCICFSRKSLWPRRVAVSSPADGEVLTVFATLLLDAAVAVLLSPALVCVDIEGLFIDDRLSSESSGFVIELVVEPSVLISLRQSFDMPLLSTARMVSRSSTYGSSERALCDCRCCWCCCWMFFRLVSCVIGLAVRDRAPIASGLIPTGWCVWMMFSRPMLSTFSTSRSERNARFSWRDSRILLRADMRGWRSGVSPPTSRRRIISAPEYIRPLINGGSGECSRGGVPSASTAKCN